MCVRTSANSICLAVKSRAQQLELDMSDEEIKKVTPQIKNLSDIKHLSLGDVDELLRTFHTHIKQSQ